MAGFIIMKKLTHSEAIENMLGIERWFLANPTRKVCQTDVFKVRRGHVVEDIAKHAEALEAKR